MEDLYGEVGGDYGAAFCSALSALFFQFDGIDVLRERVILFVAAGLTPLHKFILGPSGDNLDVPLTKQEKIQPREKPILELIRSVKFLDSHPLNLLLLFADCYFDWSKTWILHNPCTSGTVTDELHCCCECLQTFWFDGVLQSTNVVTRPCISDEERHITIWNFILITCQLFGEK